MKFKNTYLLEDAAIKTIENFNEEDLASQEYEDIRIPGIVTTESGAIVCAYELRRTYVEDIIKKFGNILILF